MAKAQQHGKIKIRTPQTTDGVNIAYDEDGKALYRETTLPASARKHFESLNANLPAHLRHKIEEVKTEPAKAEKAEKTKDADKA